MSGMLEATRTANRQAAQMVRQMAEQVISSADPDTVHQLNRQFRKLRLAGGIERGMNYRTWIAAQITADPKRLAG